MKKEGIHAGSSLVRADKNAHVRKGAPSIRPHAWTGLDLLNGRAVPSLTIVLRTKGCYWARRDGCTMCGYINDADQNASGPLVYEEFLGALSRYGEECKIIKVFTSGSFLDEDELPTDVRDAILYDLKDVPKTIIESRPEFVTFETCEEIARINRNIEVAIGLETSNDYIRKNLINKGFTFRDFIKASEAARSSNFSIKAYLLLKPPFLTEAEALRDAVQSVRDAAKYANIISLNLCNVQKGTLVEALWKKRLYRPPWLWTAVEVLKQAAENATIICDPVAGGTRRGPHNCGTCDRKIAEEIRRFSLSQDLASFKVTCTDKVLWDFVLEFEEFSYGVPLVP